jgi:TonB-dependent SusC/RagA subfamily outer membrane receptor
MNNLNFKEKIPVRQTHRLLLRRLLSVLLMFFLFFTGFTTLAQTLRVSGTVTDPGGNTLPGVNVVIKGTTTGAVTDVDGRYSISVSSGSTLVYSFVGMDTREVLVTDQQTINMVLQYSMVGLEEMVIIGYGTQSRRTITSAVTRVEGEQIENLPLTAVTTALQGKLAGVRIWQSEGGQPGANASIRIRGGSSITQSNSPLILVDGIERNLNNINPADIESIQVLKDAASTAIYGSRASNGVLLVTTKQGQLGKSEITFSSNTGFASPWRIPELLGAEDYLNLVRPAVYRSIYRNTLNGAFNYGGGNTEESQWSPRYLGAGESVPAGYLSMPDPIDPTRTLIYQDKRLYGPGPDQQGP